MFRWYMISGIVLTMMSSVLPINLESKWKAIKCLLTFFSQTVQYVNILQHKGEKTFNLSFLN